MTINGAMAMAVVTALVALTAGCGGMGDGGPPSDAATDHGSSCVGGCSAGCSCAAGLACVGGSCITIVCTAGTSQACTCTDGRGGSQTCNGIGSGYDACACAALDGGTDAGTDAGFDAGFDAGTDAGPPPCGPATCSGCCSGGTCVSLWTTSQCGSGGGACMTCMAHYICPAGACELDPTSAWNVTLETLSVSTTKYDGSAWDAFGGAPDPFVNVIVGARTMPPVMSGTATDTFAVTYDGSPTVMLVGADALEAYLEFDVWDSDVSSNDEIGACTFPVTVATFSGATQTLTCPIDAATMNSGYTLTFHLSPWP